jgi:hypothetical protein
MNTDQTLTDKLKVIALYDGWQKKEGFNFLYKKKGRSLSFDQFKYKKSFDWLMPVWSKLLGDLEKLELSEWMFEKILNDWMHVCCFHPHDPSKAFEVVCEAVDLVTNQKVKQ